MARFLVGAALAVFALAAGGAPATHASARHCGWRSGDFRVQSLTAHNTPCGTAEALITELDAAAGDAELARTIDLRGVYGLKTSTPYARAAFQCRYGKRGDGLYSMKCRAGSKGVSAILVLGTYRWRTCKVVADSRGYLRRVCGWHSRAWRIRLTDYTGAEPVAPEENQSEPPTVSWAYEPVSHEQTSCEEGVGCTTRTVVDGYRAVTTVASAARARQIAAAVEDGGAYLDALHAPDDARVLSIVIRYPGDETTIDL